MYDGEIIYYFSHCLVVRRRVSDDFGSTSLLLAFLEVPFLSIVIYLYNDVYIFGGSSIIVSVRFRPNKVFTVIYIPISEPRERQWSNAHWCYYAASGTTAFRRSLARAHGTFSSHHQSLGPVAPRASRTVLSAASISRQ